MGDCWYTYERVHTYSSVTYGAIAIYYCLHQQTHSEEPLIAQITLKTAPNFWFGGSSKNNESPVFVLLTILFSNRKIQATPEDLKEYVICRYYDEKAEVMDRNERMSKPEAPLREKRQKFHYKFKDGSSFI